ncbi:hypothetical protein SXCC_02970 [Gluconacetobacter sp. SXCC-1]|nr:hypothetical protein SXCC_02970 [Gluconacetobacter sp. SXCC-1]
MAFNCFMNKCRLPEIFMGYALSRFGRKSTGSRAEKLRIGALRGCKRPRDSLPVFVFVGCGKTDS